LAIGKPNDQFEQEADRMAEQVMHVAGRVRGPGTKVLGQSDHNLQRKCACGGTPGLTGESEECQKKRLALQTKLKVNETEDIYEQEAGTIAGNIKAMGFGKAWARYLPSMKEGRNRRIQDPLEVLTMNCGS
jgi:hypothetical protein